MRKRKIKSSSKNNVNDIINKVIRGLRKELMASTKEPELSYVDNTRTEPVVEPMIKDEIVNTPKKRGRKKKVTEPTKENDSLSVEGDIDYSKIKEPKNLKLTRARKAKNDEFYTRLCDVENELRHYSEHFKDKVVLCNCDDPTWSAFWKYFHINFSILGLKKLTGTHFENKEPHSYAVVYEGGNDDNINDAKTEPLIKDGDFRSTECLEYLKECDIVVTNPPFSLFREFIGTLRSYNKKFLVVGNKNAINYKCIFDLIRDNKACLGYSNISILDLPDGTERKDGGLSRWFTNLEIKKRYEDLLLYKTYNSIDYPKYDNYDAINVDKVKDIPMDYDGVMGVPISFIDKYNPNQFEIVGLTYEWASGSIKINGYSDYTPSVNGVQKYRRLLIRRKHN